MSLEVILRLGKPGGGARLPRTLRLSCAFAVHIQTWSEARTPSARPLMVDKSSSHPGVSLACVFAPFGMPHGYGIHQASLRGRGLGTTFRRSIADHGAPEVYTVIS